jgi:hypothetical protein
MTYTETNLNSFKRILLGMVLFLILPFPPLLLSMYTSGCSKNSSRSQTTDALIGQGADETVAPIGGGPAVVDFSPPSGDIIVSNVPWFSQIAEAQTPDWSKARTCGPACSAYLDRHHSHSTTSMKEVSDFIHAAFPGYGGWNNGDGSYTTFDMNAAFLRSKGFTVTRVEKADFQTLKAELAAGRPVFVWAETQGGNSTSNMVDGADHFMLVVGITPTDIVVHDPGRSTEAQGRYRHYSLASFLAIWKQKGCAAMTVVPRAVSARFVDAGISIGTGASNSGAARDLNGDGRVDVVLANGLGTGKPAEVWFGTAQGTFADSTQRLGSYEAQSVAVGDIDRDGDLDVVLGVVSAGSRLFTNDGNGFFTEAQVFAAGNPTQSIALADIDGDGDLDLAMGNNVGQNAIWRNDNGTFTDTGQRFGTPFPNQTRAVIFGDVDRDGDFDLVAGNELRPSRLYLNNGAGVFTDSGQDLLDDAVFSATLGDVDGDHDLDLVFGLAGTNADRVFFNNSGVFSDSGQRLSNLSTFSVALADVDRDGDLDILAGHKANQGTRIYMNDGRGNFTDTGQVLGSANVSEVVPLDIDGDGDVDYLSIDETASRLWRNQ